MENIFYRFNVKNIFCKSIALIMCLHFTCNTNATTFYDNKYPIAYNTNAINFSEYKYYNAFIPVKDNKVFLAENNNIHKDALHISKDIKINKRSTIKFCQANSSQSKKSGIFYNNMKRILSSYEPSLLKNNTCFKRTTNDVMEHSEIITALAEINKKRKHNKNNNSLLQNNFKHSVLKLTKRNLLDRNNNINNISLRNNTCPNTEPADSQLFIYKRKIGIVNKNRKQEHIDINNQNTNTSQLDQSKSHKGEIVRPTIIYSIQLTPDNVKKHSHINQKNCYNSILAQDMSKQVCIHLSDMCEEVSEKICVTYNKKDLITRRTLKNIRSSNKTLIKPIKIKNSVLNMKNNSHNRQSFSFTNYNNINTNTENTHSNSCFIPIKQINSIEERIIYFK